MNSEHGYAARRTAFFLRMLAEEMVPQNKLWELVHQLRERTRYNDAPEDFTGRELSMAASLGLTGKELDEACDNRVGQYREAFEKEQKRANAIEHYWRASEEKADGFRREADHLRQAFKVLGLIAPEVTE